MQKAQQTQTEDEPPTSTVDPMQSAREAMKRKDFEIAMLIAGYANMGPREDVQSQVWTVNQATGSAVLKQLIRKEDVQRLLMEVVRQNIEDARELTKDTSPDELLDWTLDVATKWERKYQDRLNQYTDISKFILAAMHETVFEFTPALERTELEYEKIKQVARRVSAQHPHLRPVLLSVEDAAMRFLFRNEHTCNLMCWVTGKLLQKKVVCMRAGTYSSRLQRNDVTQERDDALRVFCSLTEANDEMFDKAARLLDDEDAVVQFFVDHARMDEINADANVHGETAFEALKRPRVA